MKKKSLRKSVDYKTHPQFESVEYFYKYSLDIQDMKLDYWPALWEHVYFMSKFPAHLRSLKITDEKRSKRKMVAITEHFKELNLINI